MRALTRNMISIFIGLTLAPLPVATGFGIGRVELIENHLFFARLASEEFVSSTSNVTCLFLNIAYCQVVL